ncbi:response regulator [bacterium]|jgi:two-component system response regulator (stage 0 sporulation protein F)|nr:response regulator [bacterium]
MKRILVIDDDEGIRKLFLLSLEGKGFQIDTAESGEQGIEIMQQTKYDLIYLDLKMPDMNGVETLRELRKMNKDVPVYIITAFHEEYFDQLKAAEEDGIDFELLKKPFDSEQLILVTKGVLDGPERY